jgi:uncharacterized protein YcbK (DUF882 family)
LEENLMIARVCLVAALVALVPGEAIPLAPLAGKTSGLHPNLVKRLRAMSGSFGRTIEVTSGCRSRRNNRGVKNSYHLRCMAADVRIKGVGTAKIVNYWRSNGGGGTGTYGCSPPHVDIGPTRSWHWPCRGKRHKRH